MEEHARHAGALQETRAAGDEQNHAGNGDERDEGGGAAVIKKPREKVLSERGEHQHDGGGHVHGHPHVDNREVRHVGSRHPCAEIHYEELPCEQHGKAEVAKVGPHCHQGRRGRVFPLRPMFPPARHTVSPPEQPFMMGFPRRHSNTQIWCTHGFANATQGKAKVHAPVRKPRPTRIVGLRGNASPRKQGGEHGRSIFGRGRTPANRA